MNSSIFGTNESEDPWENGWASSQPLASSTSTPFGGGGGAASGLLASSSILHDTHTGGGTSSILGDSSVLAHPAGLDASSSSTTPYNVPASYTALYEKLATISTSTQLDQHFFNPLIAAELLTSFQKSKILDVIFDHNLLPANNSNKFYQILGLLALELDVPGSGDFVSLQFHLNNLPDFPESAISAFNGDSEREHETGRSGPAALVSPSASTYFADPLNAQLANTSISEDDHHGGRSSLVVDPILTDHTSIQRKQSDVGAASKSTSDIDGPSDVRELNSYVNEIRDTFHPLSASPKKTVRIKEVPEKEGLLFKHINYNITHDLNLGLQCPAGSKKVIRRYSDFVWLLEFLLKKYPFRVIPGLPPKKFTGSSPDSQFLQKRRRGLYRFLNQLVKHPVLVQEPVVVTFLSVPTDLATWRKQAKVDYSLEFKGLKISTHFINSIWPAIGDEFLKDWQKSEQDVTKLIEVWTKIVLLVERYEKRQQQISYDNGKFVEMLHKFQDLNGSIYPNSVEQSRIIGGTNQDDISSMNDSLGSISNFFNKSSQLLIDESYTINTTILEKFKNYLDYLYSLQELFERSKKLSINNIPQLQNRIQENEKKYAKISTDDADIKGSELAKLRQVIINDKQEIFQQLNRDWLIKECCFREFVMFQETQYLVGEMWIEWSQGRFKFQEKFGALQESLNGQVSVDMPYGR